MPGLPPLYVQLLFFAAKAEKIAFIIALLVTATSTSPFSLTATLPLQVPARGKALVKTDIAVICPPGTYGRVAPRSGLAWKNSIDVGAGVIDADYRGNVGVILFNHSDADFEVKKGDRIAQLILEKIVYADIEEVEMGADLDKTARGAGGFGSTGVSGAPTDSASSAAAGGAAGGAGAEPSPSKKQRVE